MLDTPENVWPFDKIPPDPHLTQKGLGHTRFGFNARPVANWPKNTDPKYFPDDMKKKSQLGNRALLADLIISKMEVKKRHRAGINVLYGNWAGVWVPLTDFNKQPWSDIPDGQVSTAHNDTMLNENGKYPVGIWADLDNLYK